MNKTEQPRSSAPGRETAMGRCLRAGVRDRREGRSCVASGREPQGLVSSWFPLPTLCLLLCKPFFIKRPQSPPSVGPGQIRRMMDDMCQGVGSRKTAWPEGRGGRFPRKTQARIPEAGSLEAGRHEERHPRGAREKQPPRMNTRRGSPQWPRAGGHRSGLGSQTCRFHCTACRVCS